MRGLARGLRELSRSGPNRIALSTAVRGTLATVVPLATLPELGAGELAYPAVLGSLAASLVDVGGPYRTRLVAMLLQATAGPCLLLLGVLVSGYWWLAAPLMAAIAILSGLIRALGPGGTSLGNNAAVAFLVGLQLGRPSAWLWALGYGCGGLWTVLVALGFWQLRPYRRLEQEVASAWQAVAALLDAISQPPQGSLASASHWEQRIAAARAAELASLERSRDTLGEMRAGMAGPGTSVAQLIVLLDNAAAVGATAMSLCEISATQRAGRGYVKVERELAKTCRAVAGVLLKGSGALALEEQHRAFEAARSAPGRRADRAALLGWAQALRSLDAAQEALRLLFGARHRMPDLLRLPFAHRLPRGAVRSALRAHATPRSAIFRHAMRVAAVTGLDTVVLVRFQLPHGIWLPLTSLVILQPDYGGTATRAVQRSLGTIGGAVIAGVLLATLHGTVGYDAALAVLLFATFLLIRRNYGYGITFLTPIIILLIGMRSVDPWVDLLERVAYTVAGALLALGAAYLLWPNWERDQLRERLAQALRSVRLFFDAALRGRLDGRPVEGLGALQGDAEMAIANAEASFQRTRAEPASRTAPLGVAFSLLVYLRRLCRHTIALAAQPESLPLPAEPLDRLRLLMTEVLDELATVIREGRPVASGPGLQLQLTHLSSQLAPGQAREALAQARGPDYPQRAGDRRESVHGVAPQESADEQEGGSQGSRDEPDGAPQGNAGVMALLTLLMSDLTGLLSAAGYTSTQGPACDYTVTAGPAA